MIGALLTAVALAGELDLALYRSRAALLNGDAEGAWTYAGAALALDPESWQAHEAWQRALSTSVWWLDAEYAALAESGDPERELLAVWWASQGGAPFAPPPGANPQLSAELSGRALLDRGDPQAALAALGSLNTPEASKLRMEAYFELEDDHSLRAEARRAQSAWPQHYDLLVWLVRDDSLLGKSQRSRAVSAATAALGGSDVEALYRAHVLFVAAGQSSLAEAAAARLTALGEPYPLPSRYLWKPAMVRDLGRVLSMQKVPELPPGGVPDESQRVLAAAAIALENKGRPERAADIWRMALAADEPDCLTTMRAAGALQTVNAPAEELLSLARSARLRCAAEADPGPAGTAVREAFVESWTLEADVLIRQGQYADALIAARTAVELGAGPQALVTLGRSLEGVGDHRAALLAYAQAAARGAPEAKAAMERLYGGPADAAVLIDAVSALEPGRPPPAPPPRAAERFPARSLTTNRGEVAVGQGSFVLVAFWASWCGPCGEELPQLDAWAGRAAAEKLPIVVVAVSVDDQEAAMARWLRNHELKNLAVARDPGLGRELGLTGIPTTLLIGPDGTVLARHQGYAEGDVERLDADLREALNAPHP